MKDFWADLFASNIFHFSPMLANALFVVLQIAFARQCCKQMIPFAI